MTEPTVLADDLERQLAHWMSAARSFLDAEAFASRTAWESLEHTIGLPIRSQLARTVDELIRGGRAAADVVRGSRTDPARLPAAQAAVQRFRRLYLQVETTLDFFGQAVNSRTSPQLRATMQTLDRLARQSIETTLRPLGITVPPVLTYIGDGLGASIIRAGIRLWAPGTVNPVAAIKIVRHNLYRPTSLFHETGHQVAHLTGWNDTLATGLSQTLADDPPLRSMWQPWASEIAADVYAFALTGYASVAALYDVVADERTILRWPLGDPHPIGWLRTLLGCAMCRHVYGTGPWDRLETAMTTASPATRAEASTVPLLLRSRTRMPAVAASCLELKVPGLRDRPVTDLVDPKRVSPTALAELERATGPALWTSPHWRQEEGIRIVALAGLREAERPDRASAWADRVHTWITGGLRAA
ncbi:MAG TPA: hypothetical protein VGF54_01385 [Streptosporangiaceae bacterium]